MLHTREAAGSTPAAPILRVPTHDASAELATYLREWLIKIGGPAMPEDAGVADLLVQALIRSDIRL